VRQELQRLEIRIDLLPGDNPHTSHECPGGCRPCFFAAAKRSGSTR
jgi:hypothetical protein